MNKVMLALTVDEVVLVVGMINLGLGLVLYREEANTRKIEITFNHGIDAIQTIWMTCLISTEVDLSSTVRFKWGWNARSMVFRQTPSVRVILLF